MIPLLAAVVIPDPVVEEPPPPPTPPPPPEPPPPVLIKPGWAYGVVRFLGEAPPKRKFRHGDSMALSQELMIDGEGGVKWAFVYVAEGVKEEPPEVSDKVVELEVRGGRFNPHVLGLRVGQKLEIPGREGDLHYLRLTGMNNRTARWNQKSARERPPIIFDREDVMIRVKCIAHSLDGGWVGVLNHPHFSVTDGGGFWFIGDLLPGPYEIRVWHEKLASQRLWIDVPEGEGVQRDIYVLGLKR